MVPVSDAVDAARIAALRAGDERAFAEFVDELSARMLKLARAVRTLSEEPPTERPTHAGPIEAPSRA